MASDQPTGTSVDTRPRIHLEGVAKSFNGRTVVDVEQLTLGDHPIEGLIGPNGAGKTTRWSAM
jgi:ABC-type branched-subunit amino acid transport system ATPase component